MFWTIINELMSLLTFGLWKSTQYNSQDDEDEIPYNKEWDE